nr:hypothetical protein [Tanacetum cinerariifolium]
MNSLDIRKRNFKNKGKRAAPSSPSSFPLSNENEEPSFLTFYEELLNDTDLSEAQKEKRGMFKILLCMNEYKGAKKSKTSETTSGSASGGFNLNNKADEYEEEAQEHRPIGHDRSKAKKKSSAFSREGSSSFVDLELDIQEAMRKEAINLKREKLNIQQYKGAKKSKTSETTSGSASGGFNLNNKADEYEEEAQEHRPIGHDRSKAKKKSSAFSREGSSSFVDLIALLRVSPMGHMAAINSIPLIDQSIVEMQRVVYINLSWVSAHTILDVGRCIYDSLGATINMMMNHKESPVMQLNKMETSQSSGISLVGPSWLSYIEIERYDAERLESLQSNIYPYPIVAHSNVKNMFIITLDMSYIMATQIVLMEWLEPDMSLKILTYLDDSADLIRVAVVAGYLQHIGLFADIEIERYDAERLESLQSNIYPYPIVAHSNVKNMYDPNLPLLEIITVFCIFEPNAV